MAKEKETFEKEIHEIRSELTNLRADLKRFIEQSNRLHHESVISGIQKDFSNVIVGHVAEDIEDGLEKNMIRNCEMRDTCRSVFTGFLQKNTGLIKQSKVDEGIISKNRSELQEMKNNAPK